jgi:3-hydroxyisobutyrate dehydrogenase-like beta-hydroxyacid dehydrogenase
MPTDVVTRTNSATPVGFVGLGNMGLPMTRRLLGAGFPVRAFDPRAEQVAEAVASGATAATSPGDAADGADVLITMITTEAIVWEAVTGADGALTRLRPGSLLMQMGTVSPAFVRRLAEAARAKGVHLIDAPVARGWAAAAKGELLALVGATNADLERATPLIDVLASTVRHVGDVGAASTVKLVNNMIVASIVSATCEGLALGVKAGIAVDALVPALENGSADSWALRNMMPAVLKGLTKTGSQVNILAKDLSLAVGAAAELGVPLSVARATRALYLRAVEAGFGFDDSCSVIHVVEDDAGVTIRFEGAA